jgi:hypothetical protein
MAGLYFYLHLFILRSCQYLILQPLNGGCLANDEMETQVKAVSILT